MGIIIGTTAFLIIAERRHRNNLKSFQIINRVLLCVKIFIFAIKGNAMFFSGAITIILPYLLFFGVLTTVFYGIAEKINPSGESKAEYSENGFHLPSHVTEHAFFYDQYEKEDNIRSSYHQFLSALNQKQSFQYLLYQVDDIFDPPIIQYSNTNIVFSLRGPPNFQS